MDTWTAFPVPFPMKEEIRPQTESSSGDGDMLPGTVASASATVIQQQQPNAASPTLTPDLPEKDSRKSSLNEGNNIKELASLGSPPPTGSPRMRPSISPLPLHTLDTGNETTNKKTSSRQTKKLLPEIRTRRSSGSASPNKHLLAGGGASPRAAMDLHINTAMANDETTALSPITQSPKSQTELIMLKSNLHKSIWFSSVNTSVLDQVIAAFERIPKNKGDILFQVGDAASEIYLIDSGTVGIYGLDRATKQPKKVGEMMVGDVACQTALRHSVAAKFESAGAVWMLSRTMHEEIVRKDLLMKRQLYMDLLINIPMLESLTSVEKSALADAMDERVYADGEYVIRQGERGDAFFILVDGEADVIKTDIVTGKAAKVFHYSKGGFFGEIALLTNKARLASVVSCGESTIASVDRGSFDRLLGPAQEIMKRNMDKYAELERKYLMPNAPKPKAQDGPTMQTIASPKVVTANLLELSALNLQRSFMKRFLPNKLATRRFFAAAKYGLTLNILKAIRDDIDLELTCPDEPDPFRRAMHIAVLNGHVHIVSELISAGAKASAQDSKGLTPLHYACKLHAGNKPVPNAAEIVQCILRRQPQAGNIACNEGYYALHMACQNQLPDIVQVLCEANVDKEAVDKLGQTALHIAATLEEDRIAGILLQCGANVNATAFNGRTPIHFAASHGSLDCCSSLIQARASLDIINFNGNTPLHLAIMDGAPEVAALLIEAGAGTHYPNINGDSALRLAVDQDVEVATAILNNRYHVTSAVNKNDAFRGKELIGVSYDFRGLSEQAIRIHRGIVVPGIGELHPMSQTATAFSQTMEVKEEEKSKRRRRNAIHPIEVHQDQPKRPGSPRETSDVPFHHSVLKRIVSQDSGDLVSHPVVVKLMELKWSSFARREFLFSFGQHVLLTILFCFATLAWHGIVEHRAEEYSSTTILDYGGSLHMACGFACCVLLCYMLITDFVPFIITQIRRRQLLSAILRLDFWFGYDFLMEMGGFLFLTIQQIRILNADPSTTFQATSRIGASIFSLMLWGRYLQFMSAHRRTGPFVKIIAVMLWKDTTNFMIVCSVFLLAFGHAFFLLLQGNLHSTEILLHTSSFDNLVTSVIGAFRLMLGEFDHFYERYEIVESEAIRDTMTAMYICFMTIMTILMLNLVIAMLDETWGQHKAQMEREWRLQWTTRILNIEERLAFSTLHRLKIEDFHHCQESSKEIQSKVASYEASNPLMDEVKRSREDIRLLAAELKHIKTMLQRGTVGAAGGGSGSSGNIKREGSMIAADPRTALLSRTGSLTGQAIKRALQQLAPNLMLSSPMGRSGPMTSMVPSSKGSPRVEEDSTPKPRKKSLGQSPLPKSQQ